MKEWKLHAVIAELNLKETDVFADVGGYRGDVTAIVRKLFDCTCYIYEPYPEFYEQCRKRFENDPKVTAFNYGLGNGNRQQKLYYHADGTSLYDEGSVGVEVEIRDAKEVLKDFQAIKLNCEGAEYEILESIRDSLAPQMLIQFHKHGGDKNEAVGILKKTHTMVWPKARKRWELWRQ